MSSLSAFIAIIAAVLIFLVMCASAVQMIASFRRSRRVRLTADGDIRTALVAATLHDLCLLVGILFMYLGWGIVQNGLLFLLQKLGSADQIFWLILTQINAALLIAALALILSRLRKLYLWGEASSSPN